MVLSGKISRRFVDIYHPEWTSVGFLSKAVEIFKDKYALGLRPSCRESVEFSSSFVT